MNTHLSRASSCPDGVAPSLSETRKRPKFSPRRTLSAASRAFLTLALATCALGAAASAQTISISPPTNSPNTFEGSGGGQTPFEFTVSIDQAPAQDVTVTFAINNGTATGSPSGAGADFANGVGSVLVNGNPSQGNTLTFAAGSTASQTIVVPVTADNAFEADETFNVSIVNPTGGAGIGMGTATATIGNDDNQPNISIADAAPVTEGNAGTRNANFTVSLDAVSGQDVTFTFNTVVVDPNNAGDGNNGGQDFTPQTNQVGVITAGQISTNIAVPIIGDTFDEATGQFLVEISSVNGANTANGQATGTILDDDGPSVAVTDATASESDGQVVFRISLSAPSPEPITVRYRTGSNSAIAGQDYGNQGSNTEIDQTVTFEAFNGDPSTGTAPFIDVPIPVIDDNISENTEIFNFTIVTASNNASINGPGSRRQAIGTIQDNDGAPNLTVTAPANGVVEGNGNVNTPAVFQVTLSNPSSNTVTFRYVTVAGTATENQDFTAIQTSRVGTIAAGQTSTTVSVNVVGDNIDEANETFGLRVFGASTGVTIGNSNEQTATTTIIDDDGPTVTVVPTNVNVNEGNNGATTAAAFTVQLNNTSQQAVTVNFTLGGSGNNANEATRGRDYNSQSTSGTLTFPVGSTTQQVPVTILGDNTKESNEIITLTLSAANGGSLGANTTGTITIIDDDATPVLNITGPPQTREGNSGTVTNFVFRVSLDRPTSSTVTVNFTVNDRTATVADADFTAPGTNGNNTLTFNPGTTGPQTVTVPVRADRLNEDDETFSVSLSGATNARIGVGSVIATILNDDALPTLSIFDSSGLETGDPPPANTPAGPRIIPFTVRLNVASGKDITFVAQTTGAGPNNPTLTALANADFLPLGGRQFTIPAGALTPDQPLGVTVVADTLDEDDERFSVTLSNVNNATIARGGAIGTITDDDAAPNVNVDPPNADNTAVEPYVTFAGGTPTNGRNAIFPVTLSAASGRTITVRYTITGGANPSAFNNDFLINPSDTTRVFQSGTLVFSPGQGNNATPTVQNIVLFPRGDDGDEEATENYVLNITATNANFAAAADATANSTIADRDPQFNNFTPDVGNQPFGNVLGTLITITGNQFVTDQQSRVAAVRFTGPTGVALDATNLNVTANTITARVPAGAFSSTVTVVLTSGRVLNTVDPGSRRLFFVQPVVTGFNPTEGVPAVTQVTITGLHFRDPRNPVNAVLFNGLASTPANADRGFTVVNDTTITAFVPRGASSGPISIRTQFGGNGPASEQTFTVNGFQTGGLRFQAGSDLTEIYENAQATFETRNGQLLNPVRAFNLLLQPATQNNGNNTPIAPRRTFRVTVTLTAALPAGTPQVVPVITLDPRVRIPGISLVSSTSSTITFDVAAGRDPNAAIPLVIIYAGDDQLPPSGQGNLTGTTDPATGLTLPIIDNGIQMTLVAQIVTSGDTELYPTTGQFSNPQLQFRRLDFHTFATDTSTTLRTTEDQNSPNNRAAFQLDLGNLDFPNPDPFTPNIRQVRNPINVDARPIGDVLVTLESSNLGAGRLTYYVIQNGVRVFPSGAQPQNGPLQVIYATNPNRPEYFRNPHFIQAIGQDDQLATGDTPFQVTVTQIRSTDAEYRIPVTGAFSFQFVNIDNEQGTGRNDPAFLFSKLNLTTNESGSRDTFTARLRIQPAGNVVVRFETDRPEEVLFVDPNNPNGPGLSSINVTFLATGNGSPSNLTTNWRVALPISVRGVDDDITDGDQQAQIITTVVSSGDVGYGSIDPPDLFDTNTDNESNGVTIFPTTLSVLENATNTFAVRLNARPTSDVTITFFSSDGNIASIDGSDTLTFTPQNFNTTQTITVRGVPDGSFAQQRTATIVSANATSGDTNFNGLVVADVTVIVRNNDSAFVVNSPSAGLRTGENGTNDLFTVALGQQPTSNVTLVLSANPATEARLSRTTGGATPSVTLTFTPTNFANPQTVNVIGQDDNVADSDRTFNITGRVTTGDPNFSGQSFPVLQGVNTDNESGTGGGGGGNTGTTSFAANSTFTFSVPFASTTAANGTIPVRSLFSPSSATDFRIYRFNVSGQANSRLIGEDFQLVPNTGTLQRGIGYILQTGATPVTLNTSNQAFSGTSFSFNLTRNTNFVNQTGQSNSNNGFNFIGFPFNPSQFSRVSFTSARVQVGSDIYENVRDAAAAGVISDRLFTMDSRGNLTQVSASDQFLRPYRAYFVQVYRDNVTLTFRSPSAN